MFFFTAFFRTFILSKCGCSHIFFDHVDVFQILKVLKSPEEFTFLVICCVVFTARIFVLFYLIASRRIRHDITAQWGFFLIEGNTLPEKVQKELFVAKQNWG